MDLSYKKLYEECGGNEETLFRGVFGHFKRLDDDTTNEVFGQIENAASAIFPIEVIKSYENMCIPEFFVPVISMSNAVKDITILSSIEIDESDTEEEDEATDDTIIMQLIRIDLMDGSEVYATTLE